MRRIVFFSLFLSRRRVNNGEADRVKVQQLRGQNSPEACNDRTSAVAAWLTEPKNTNNGQDQT